MSVSRSSRGPRSHCFKHLEWQPDVVHGNDWPCGFAMVELRARTPLRRVLSQDARPLFSIHNLAYQGAFDPNDLWWLGFGESPEKDDFMLKGMASALKAGLIAADALSTVSRRYAQEIQTPEQGAGLDWLLRARRDRLAGITNGVDYELWNPETDPHIAANFSAEDLSGKRECKRDLLRRFDLPQNLERPIIAIISRLVSQKGYDLIRQLAGAIRKQVRSSSRSEPAPKSTKTFCSVGTIARRVRSESTKAMRVNRWRIRSRRAQTCF